MSPRIPKLSDYATSAPPMDEVRLRALELAIGAIGTNWSRHTDFTDLAAVFESYLRGLTSYPVTPKPTTSSQ